jgi:hypothetical protein
MSHGFSRGSFDDEVIFIRFKIIFPALVVASLLGPTAIASAQTQPNVDVSAQSYAMASMRNHRMKSQHHRGIFSRCHRVRAAVPSRAIRPRRPKRLIFNTSPANIPTRSCRLQSQGPPECTIVFLLDQNFPRSFKFRLLVHRLLFCEEIHPAKAKSSDL